MGSIRGLGWVDFPRIKQTSSKRIRSTHYEIIPHRNALTAASVRSSAHSLARIFRTWVLTVPTVMNNRSAIATLVQPATISSRTSRSRSVTGSEASTCSYSGSNDNLDRLSGTRWLADTLSHLPQHDTGDRWIDPSIASVSHVNRFDRLLDPDIFHAA